MEERFWDGVTFDDVLDHYLLNGLQPCFKALCITLKSFGSMMLFKNFARFCTDMVSERHPPTFLNVIELLEPEKNSE